MSDIVIVSRDQFMNGHAPEGHVPYGTILDDESGMIEAETETFESMFPGAVLSVDWRGVDQVDATPRRGRPRKGV
jgi:hypothetical protein